MQEIADQSKSDNQEQSDEQGEKGEQTDQEGTPEEDSDEEGDEISEIAKELLDKERRERERRQAYRATGRPTKVEKDW